MTATLKAKQKPEPEASPSKPSPGKGKGKGKGHWVTVSYPNGGYHHIFVPGADGAGAVAAVGKHVPKKGAKALGHKTGESTAVKHAHEVTRSGQVVTTPGPGSPAKKATRAARRRQYSEGEEVRIKKIVDGEHVTGNKPSDVDAKKKGGGLHKIEVKSKHFGAKQVLSVHDSALEQKIDASIKNPEDTWHTVLLDTRHTSEDGAHAKHYSGHEMYYKRAVGPYPVKQMHAVKDEDELRRLIAMKDHELPEKARGAFPKGRELIDLRVRAKAQRETNNLRSKDRKAKLKAEGKSAYRAELDDDDD